MTAAPSAESPRIEVHPLTADRLPAFQRLFESRGTLRGCWCMIFRADVTGRVPPPNRAERNRAMRDLVEADHPVGLLGYADDAAVAWCSVAPRQSFRGLDVVGSADEPVWSLTCFYVQRDYRGTGVTRALLGAAIIEASAHGASALEAYPVEPDSPSYRFGGFIPFFEGEGFEVVGRLGLRRHVMRKQLRPYRKG
jgi:GNAT superfamily N-acetyltransferase